MTNIELLKKIRLLEAENKALRTRPLAIAPRKPMPAPVKPLVAAPKVPLMPNGKVDSLAVTRIQMRLEETAAKLASDAVFAKCTPKKTILNPSKYRA